MKELDIFAPSQEHPICARRILEIIGVAQVETLDPSPEDKYNGVHGLRCDLHNKTMALNMSTGRLSDHGCPSLED